MLRTRTGSRCVCSGSACRLARCCDAEVKRDMPAAAPRHPSLIAAIAMLTTNTASSCASDACSALAHARLPCLLNKSGLGPCLRRACMALSRPITRSVDLRQRCSGVVPACLGHSVDRPHRALNVTQVCDGAGRACTMHNEPGHDCSLPTSPKPSIHGPVPTHRT